MKMYPVQTKNQLHIPSSLRDGQMVYGKVLRFDSRGRAVVELGSSRFLADIKAPLDTLKTYWFQVNKKNDRIALQVLAPEDQGIFRSFGIEQNTIAHELLQLVKSGQLPLDRATFLKLLTWFKETEDHKTSLQVVRYMHELRLPFTKEVFFSLHTIFKGTNLAEQLHALEKELAQLGHADDLREILQHIFEKETVNWARGKDVYRAFSEILTLLGLSDRRFRDKEETQLLQVLRKNLINRKKFSPGVEARITDILRILCAFRNLLQERDGLLQGWFVIPLPLPEGKVDLHLHWSGKRSEKEKLDSDFCRILFMLQMPRLGKIEVVMHVQKRHISLTIRTDSPKVRELGKDLLPTLKEKLARKNYTVGSVRFEKSADQKDSVVKNWLKQSSRLDVRI